MNLLNRLPGFVKSPPGLERRILRRLPGFTVATTAVPLCCYLVARWFPAPQPGVTVERYLTDVGILAISFTLTAWTAIFTVAIGCCIVVLMKGPAYVADPYALSDADEPAEPVSDRASPGQDHG